MYVLTSSIALSHIPQVEANNWFKHHATSLPQLSDEDHTFIKYITGYIPLLLQPLIGMEVFNKSDFLKHKELTKAEKNINNFYRAYFQKWPLRNDTDE